MRQSASRIVAAVSVCLWLTALSFVHPAHAQTADPRYYDIGQPRVVDLWLDPANGNDQNDGTTRATALRTFTASWRRIPANQQLTNNGYRINITPGQLPCENGCGNTFGGRFGTREFPIIIRAADGPGTVTIQGGLNIYSVSYLYLIDVQVLAGGAHGAFADAVLHLHLTDHVLLRNVTMRGVNRAQTKETLKVNQCQHVYVEDCDISGASNAALDFVAVAYGHIVRNRMHDVGKWACYLKSGAAYFRIEANEIYDAWHGFAAGEGADLRYMQAPWLHYDAYDIKFVNNVLHDIRGRGITVWGGYNILLAHNTLYRVSYDQTEARTWGLIVIGSATRVCNGTVEDCARWAEAGAWGPNRPGYDYWSQAIPNRNVYIYNNVFYNPAPYQTYRSHFVIYAAPARPANYPNLPENIATDQNLQIRGNLVWNGPKEHLLGVEAAHFGCRPDNLTCNARQLWAENTINVVEPQLVNPDGGDYRLKWQPALLNAPTFAAPDFNWDDAPNRPALPSGASSNVVERDANNIARGALPTIGAYQFPVVTSISAANYRPVLAPGAMASAFGAQLSALTLAAEGAPLPTRLGGTTITVRDSQGVARLSPLFLVSPTQVNYQVPEDTAPGEAIVMVENEQGAFAIGKLLIVEVAPALFTANASGRGWAAALVLRVTATGAQSYEPVARYDPAQQRFVGVPIDLSVASEQVFLILYGAGFRRRSALSAVNVTIGGVPTQVLYAGAHPSFIGADQANVLLPHALAGRGEVDLALTADGQAANIVRVSIR
jgi:uncharacterized protein (TIGR03437 family)